MSVYKNDDPNHFCEALNSITNQTLPPNQIVLIRDGTVGSELQACLDKVKSENNLVSLFELDENVGLSKALNIGLEYCDYEYIARMDSDDISEKDRFEKQIQFMQKNSDIVLLGSWYIQYDQDMKEVVSDRKVPESHNDIVDFSKTRTPYNHVTAVFKKEQIINIGAYPEDIEGRFEDWWLSLRLIKEGYKLHNIPEYLVRVRGGDSFLDRRGGLEYLKSEIHNLKLMVDEDLIDKYSYYKNIILRGVVRLVPPETREKIYSYIRKFRTT